MTDNKRYTYSAAQDTNEIITERLKRMAREAGSPVDTATDNPTDAEAPHRWMDVPPHNRTSYGQLGHDDPKYAMDPKAFYRWIISLLYKQKEPVIYTNFARSRWYTFDSGSKTFDSPEGDSIPASDTYNTKELIQVSLKECLEQFDTSGKLTDLLIRINAVREGLAAHVGSQKDIKEYYEKRGITDTGNPMLWKVEGKPRLRKHITE